MNLKYKIIVFISKHENMKTWKTWNRLEENKEICLEDIREWNNKLTKYKLLSELILLNSLRRLIKGTHLI